MAFLSAEKRRLELFLQSQRQEEEERKRKDKKQSQRLDDELEAVETKKIMANEVQALRQVFDRTKVVMY